MKEECGLRQSDSSCGLVVTESRRFFTRNIGQLRAAVCMECGEVSVYVDMEELKRYREKQQAR